MIDDSRDLSRQSKSKLIRTFAMTARLPAIDLIGRIRLAKLLRQALPSLPVARQTIQPVILSAVIRLRWLSGQGWFGKPLDRIQRIDWRGFLKDRRGYATLEK